MATPFRIKRSAVPNKRPQLDDLQLGELAFNFYDGRLFAKKDTAGVGVGTTVTLLNPWTENIGGGIYYTDGNVGIGSTIPTSRLWVQGDANFTGVVTASSFSGNASSATYATTSGIATYAGTAGIATSLQNSRTFEITGDIIASPISFNGTGNVSLAATIQPNSVALGSDTTGDYVQTVSGTSNQITVTNGTGESSTPTLSIPSQFTAPQDVTVTRDLQVNRNLNVTGNITIGGTSATLFTSELKVSDPDLVLGFRTDGSGNDTSTDNTANHGGIAIASTEGTPLVQLFLAGIETTPATYKKIMWFKAGTFSGLGTDAWLSNYAVGIGSTQFPTGTRLAAGGVQITERDLAVVRNINASGVVTATSFSGNATSATYASTAGIATNLIGGIASVTQLNVSGITTLASAGGITTTGGDLYVGNDLFFKNKIYQNGQLFTSGIGIGSTSINPGSGVINQRIGVGFTDINIVGTGISVTGYGSTVVIDFGNINAGGAALSISTVTNPRIQDVTFVGGATTSRIGISTQTDRFVYDTQTGSIGVGTFASSIPNYKLDVIGDINSSTSVKIKGVDILEEAVRLAIAFG